jgi:DNA ligase 4
MECFQPQLAQFQMHSFQTMIDKMGGTDNDPHFWIEEKLDGERIQMHMAKDPNSEGGFRFSFWSRKGKDYTYLYGNSFEDDCSALTRHIKDAFDPLVKNIILDGEMITWDPELDVMVGFGTLKTAALSEQRDPFNATGHRPLFRVFDCLYLNDKSLTQYILKDRRKALERSINNVHRRIEIHQYQEAQQASQVEAALRKVVAEASEGLVLKNPRSIYRLNSRNDDWMKVKPEYMTEFGESLDCVVVGGYYGSGHKGGRLSSFLCGLRVGQNDIQKGMCFFKYLNSANHIQGANPMKCTSFFKVGGGFTAQDYRNIDEKTSGKWIKWDRAHPPTEFITLGGGDKQYERPDVWIKPNDSVVLEVKAASVGGSDQFGFLYTLRFPRFKRLRDDKTWDAALSVDEFIQLKARVEAESKEKKFEVDTRRKGSKKLKKEKVIAGNDTKVKTPYAGPNTKVFEGLNFCVLSETLSPQKKSKAEIEQIIKSNGGAIFQSPTAKEGIICIGDKKVVKVASLIKSGQTNIVKACWVLDALKQAEIDGPQRQRLLVPWEPKHMYHMLDVMREQVEDNVDEYGDSYTRDISVEDLKKIMDDMIHPKNSAFNSNEFLSELEEHANGLGELPASMFRRCVVRFVSEEESEHSGPNVDLLIAKTQFLFAGGRVIEGDEDQEVTHNVVVDENPEAVKSLREKMSRRTGPVARIVGLRWLLDSWYEKTLLDEETYVVRI